MLVVGGGIVGALAANFVGNRSSSVESESSSSELGTTLPAPLLVGSEGIGTGVGGDAELCWDVSLIVLRGEDMGEILEIETLSLISSDLSLVWTGTTGEEDTAGIWDIGWSSDMRKGLPAVTGAEGFANRVSSLIAPFGIAFPRTGLVDTFSSCESMWFPAN